MYPQKGDELAEDLLTGVHKKGLCFCILHIFGKLAAYSDRNERPQVSREAFFIRTQSEAPESHMCPPRIGKGAEG